MTKEFKPHPHWDGKGPSYPSAGAGTGYGFASENLNGNGVSWNQRYDGNGWGRGDFYRNDFLN